MRMDVLFAELWQSWRGLLLRRGYLTLASLTLALAVAACVSVFALVDASLLTPISVPQPEKVAVLGPLEGTHSAGGMAPIQYQYLEGLPGVQTMGIAAPGTSTVNVLNWDHPALVTSWQVDSGFLTALGVPMFLGRGFNSDESRPNGPPAVILSYGYWHQHFGGNPSVLNSTIKIDGRSTPVVGVLPGDFPYHDAELMLPLALERNNVSWSGSYLVIARLAPGTSIATAEAAVQSRLHPLDVEYKMDRFGHHNTYVAQLLGDALRAGTGSQEILALFSVCAGVVLLIVLVNLTNLSLLRILLRGRDNAMRQALGASLLRLLVPAAGEQTLVALCGSVMGLLLAFVALRLANSIIPSSWFISESIHPKIGFKGMLFALLLGLFVTVIALIISGFRSRHVQLREALVSGSRTGMQRKVGQIGRMLVVLQAVLATVLLVVAALCARTLWQASQVDYGFNGRHVLGFSVKPDRNTYPSQQQVLVMADAVVASLEAIPGSVRAAYGTNIPASGTDHNDTAPFITSNGNVIDSVASYLVSPFYFDVLGIELQQGRSFDSSHAANIDSIMISANMQKHLPKDGAVGQQLTLPYHAVNPAWNDLPLQIRGETKGVRVYGPNVNMPPIVWIPFMANTDKLYDVWRDSDSLYFVVRVQGDPAAYEKQVMAAVHNAAPELPVARLQPVRDYQASTLSQQRLNLALIAIFASMALLLSSVGMYSVMAVNVASRQQELGIRAALGARPTRLLWQVLLDGSRQTAIGLVIGIGAAFAASRLIQRFLFGISATDPVSIIIALVVLLLAGLMACFIPAVRAARVQPMQAMRVD